MATQVKPDLMIELGGKKRVMRLDLNTFAAVEDLTGLNLTEPVNWQKLKISTFRAFLWAALVQTDEDLTIKEVGSMIHVGNFEYVSEKFQEALKLVLPQPKEENAEEAKANVPPVKRAKPVVLSKS